MVKNKFSFDSQQKAQSSVLKETLTVSDSNFISPYNQPSLIPSIHPFINPPTIRHNFIHSNGFSFQFNENLQNKLKPSICPAWLTRLKVQLRQVVCSTTQLSVTKRAFPCTMPRKQDRKTQYDSVGAPVHHLSCRTRFDTISSAPRGN